MKNLTFNELWAAVKENDELLRLADWSVKEKSLTLKESILAMEESIRKLEENIVHKTGEFNNSGVQAA